MRGVPLEGFNQATPDQLRLALISALWVTSEVQSSPRPPGHLAASQSQGGNDRGTASLAGGPPGDRTRDTLIKSQVLYH